MRKLVTLGLAVAAALVVLIGATVGQQGAPAAPARDPAPVFEVGKRYAIAFAWGTDNCVVQRGVSGKVVEPPRDGWLRVEVARDGAKPMLLWVNLSRVEAVQPLDPK